MVGTTTLYLGWTLDGLFLKIMATLIALTGALLSGFTLGNLISGNTRATEFGIRFISNLAKAVFKGHLIKRVGNSDSVSASDSALSKAAGEYSAEIMSVLTDLRVEGEIDLKFEVGPILKLGLKIKLLAPVRFVFRRIRS